MNSGERYFRTIARPPRVKISAAVLLVAAVSGVVGCQGRREQLSKPAQVLLDSSLAGNEAFFDSATANLAMDRLGCLEERASRVLAQGELLRVIQEAEQTVRARHSPAEYAAGARGIQMAHVIPDEVVCKRIDSLWYVHVVKNRRTRP